MAENITVKELLDNPFYLLHDKLRTVNKCQPTSPLPN